MMGQVHHSRHNKVLLHPADNLWRSLKSSISSSHGVQNQLPTLVTRYPIVWKYRIWSYRDLCVLEDSNKDFVLSESFHCMIKLFGCLCVQAVLVAVLEPLVLVMIVNSCLCVEHELGRPHHG